MEYVPQIHSYADLRRWMQLARQWAPHLQGASETWQVNRCIDWPILPANPPRRLDVRGVPTLIVSARHDPSIPFVWATGMASQIRGSILLPRTGDGHTSYYTLPCARTAIDSYLIHPHRPAIRVCRG
jgi:pimeloyl-ACP methyl ester carboxylesterase